MPKWNIFSKNKKDEKTEEIEEKVQESSEEKPLVTYKKTLYSDDTKKTKKDKTVDRKKLDDQRIWRDVDSIEKNIDNLHIKKGGKPSTKVEEKVDDIIKKTKIKGKVRKPSNVIYVVSKPQPGQVKGDWAVRGHNKIYSHHRKKEAAIKNARKIAKKRDATVMVQNTDGTFSDGFKPRSKK